MPEPKAGEAPPSSLLDASEAFLLILNGELKLAEAVLDRLTSAQLQGLMIDCIDMRLAVRHVLAKREAP